MQSNISFQFRGIRIAGRYDMTSLHTPRLSIGLPVFNGQDYLASAIESILAQTYSDFELIISDNASTDNTPAICDEYARRDNRVRVTATKLT